MAAAENEVIPVEGELLSPETAIAVYEPFLAKLAELEAENALMVFDYTTKAGQAAARSHVYKLRQSKRPLKDAHDRAKAASLVYIRTLDGKLNEYIGRVDSMVDVHMKPIEEAEAREDERIKAHQQVLDYIAGFTADASMPSADIQKMLDTLAAVVVDESLEEFEEEAHTLQYQRVTALSDVLVSAQKREAEELELAALRAEKAARDQRDHEARIAQEAADKARAETEAAMERGRIAAEAAARTEREVAEAREKADKARIEAAEAEAAAAIENAAKAQRDAEEKAAQAVRDAEERIRLARETEATEQRLAQERREADMAHRAAINREAAGAFVTFAELNPDQAKAVVIAIALGHIPNVRIAY